MIEGQKSGLAEAESPDPKVTPKAKRRTWNIVPWYIGSGRKIRPAGGADLAAGLPYLRQLLPLLPSLRIVVIMGQKAAFAEKHIAMALPDVQIVRSPHPSPLYVNHQLGNRDKILRVLQAVAQSLSRSTAQI